MLVFDGSGKDFLEGTTEEDTKLPINLPIEVCPRLRVLTLVAGDDIWFYYHHLGERG